MMMIRKELGCLYQYSFDECVFTNDVFLFNCVRFVEIIRMTFHVSKSFGMLIALSVHVNLKAVHPPLSLFLSLSHEWKISLVFLLSHPF